MRRVVVTGLGLVTPLACGVEETWAKLIAGESGARKVTEFDTSDLATKIACIVPRGDGTNGTFNADQWVDPKEQRRIGDAVQPADPRAHEHTGAVALFFRLWIPAGIGDGLRRRRHAHDDELVDPALLLRIHPLIGIEGAAGAVAARNLTGDPGRQIRGLELDDGTGTGLAGDQAGPSLFDAAGKRRDHPKSRDHNPTHVRPRSLGS